jgi:hypothetical protein
MIAAVGRGAIPPPPQPAMFSAVSENESQQG